MTNFSIRMHTRKSSEPKATHPYYLLFFTPALVWGIFILYFSLLPGPEVPRILHEFDDKIIHGTIYFLSGSLIYLAFIRYNFSNSISRASLVITILVCIVFGAAIELLQYYLVENRTGDWMDFLANTTGAVASVLLLSLLHRVAA